MSARAFRLDSHLPADYLSDSLRADVLRGLTANPKWLPPKWFYDDRGSLLFEEITRLPEYYPTRAEREILHHRAGEIATVTAAETVVELGSGSAEKTRLLLSALAGAGTLRRYVPVDVSESALVESGAALTGEYPGLAVHAVLADFETQLGLLPSIVEPGRRLTLFLGGTLGNFEPRPRARFLRAVRGTMPAGDAFLLGVDLVKEPAVLVPAYDDAAGVTAEFNRNVLHVLNRELKADFDVDAFRHVARWDADREWIEMRLVTDRAQEVSVAALDLTLRFEAGEELRTEVSAKFRRPGIEQELIAAGFTPGAWWTDTAGRFAVSLSVAT